MGCRIGRTLLYYYCDFAETDAKEMFDLAQIFSDGSRFDAYLFDNTLFLKKSFYLFVHYFVHLYPESRYLIHLFIISISYYYFSIVCHNSRGNNKYKKGS